MNLAKKIGQSSLAFTLLAAGSLLSLAAEAAQILSYGQTGATNTVTGTRVGSNTTISTTNTPIIITQILGGSFTPALVSYSFANVSAATTTAGGDITQNFNGTFCITSAAGCGGTNYLSGTVLNVALGNGAAFSLSGSTPGPNNVTFTSSVISAADLFLERGASLAFSNVVGPLAIVNGTIDSFTASGTGTFSAGRSEVPVPASLALVGLGLLGFGVASRKA
jgi:hypothetical protein